MENQNEGKDKQAVRDACKTLIREQAPEFMNSWETCLQVSYAELKQRGILEAWLFLRGQSTVVDKYDYVTISQAIALGLIKNTPEA